jgi:hypothetical protein
MKRNKKRHENKNAHETSQVRFSMIFIKYFNINDSVYMSVHFHEVDSYSS